MFYNLRPRITITEQVFGRWNSVGGGGGGGGGRYGPRCEKTGLGVSNQVRHKPGCTPTEDGLRLEI